MVLFYWSSKLETGNVIIDGQHKRLFDLTNRIAAAVGGHDRLPDVAELLTELTNYADAHFCAEEKLLSTSLQTDKSKSRHICSHRKFSRDIQRMASRADLSQMDAVSGILEFLVDWLVTHILGMDQRMVRTLPDQSPAAYQRRGRSVSGQRTLVAALVETERRFRLLAEQAPTLIWFCGPSGERDFVNGKWLDFLGMTGAPPSRIDWTNLLFPDDQQAYCKFLRDRLQTTVSGEVEYRIKAADGTWRRMIEQVAPRMKGEECVGLVAATTDISAMRAATETLERLVEERTKQLEAQARTDPLTGLLNRRVFDERLRVEIHRAQRYGRPLSLLFCDIDHFKNFNDRYGHSFGDDLLIGVADIIRSRLRNTDIPTRYGGEEFAVILTETTSFDAMEVAEAIRAAVLQLEIAGLPQGVTISIGAALLATDDDASSFVSRADKAMYAAKNAGRNQCKTLDAVTEDDSDVGWL